MDAYLFLHTAAGIMFLFCMACFVCCVLMSVSRVILILLSRDNIYDLPQMLSKSAIAWVAVIGAGWWVLAMGLMFMADYV